jgi:hypothetical protein
VRVLPVVIVIVPSWAQIGIAMVLIMRVGGRDGIGQLTDSGGMILRRPGCCRRPGRQPPGP